MESEEERLGNLLALIAEQVDRELASNLDDETGNKSRVCRTAARFAAALEEWQPIATAPRDGTRVLLTDGQCMNIGYWETCAGVPHWWGFPFAAPTLWRHLPALPEMNRTRDPSLEVDVSDDE